MIVNLTGHHVEITEPLREYVNKKLEKVKKRFSNITSVHIVLTVEKLVQKAEGHVNVARAELHAVAEDADMYAAIDALIDKLDRQVVKHKEKLSNHKEDEL